MLQQGQAEVVSNSSNKIHQTRGPPFSLALYFEEGTFDARARKGILFPTLSSVLFSTPLYGDITAVKLDLAESQQSPDLY